MVPKVAARTMNVKKKKWNAAAVLLYFLVVCVEGRKQNKGVEKKK